MHLQVKNVSGSKPTDWSFIISSLISTITTLIFLERGLFLAMNDIDCNQIISAALSLSQLLAFFPLSWVSLSIETLFKPFIQQSPRSELFLPDGSILHASCTRPQEKSHCQREGWKYTNMQFNNQTLQPAHTVCKFQSFVLKKESSGFVIYATADCKVPLCALFCSRL